jgi:hypothetical protein
MQNSPSSTLAWLPPITLWVARVLAILILGFWGFMIVGHLTGDANAPSRPLVAYDYAILSVVAACFVGVALCFKWERLGATITLVAIAIGAILNWNLLISPYLIFPIVAALFLLHSYLTSLEVAKRSGDGR